METLSRKLEYVFSVFMVKSLKFSEHYFDNNKYICCLEQTFTVVELPILGLEIADLFCIAG